MISANIGIGFWPSFSWEQIDTKNVKLLKITNTNCTRDILVTYKNNKTDDQKTRKFYTFLIDFIEKDGELPRQLESMYRLVDFHVKRYIDRGFTSLMISCGCTGGQHRSVYSAQHIAEYIHRKYGVEVRLCHREQNISQVLKVENR